MNCLRVSPLKPLTLASRAQSFTFSCCLVGFFWLAVVGGDVIWLPCRPRAVTQIGGVISPVASPSDSLGEGGGGHGQRHIEAKPTATSRRFVPVASVMPA